MRLSTRVSLGILALAAFAGLAMWATTVHGILHPLGRAVFEGFMEETLFIADRVDAGEDPEALGRGLGVQIRPLGADPERHLRRGHRPAHRIERDGRVLVFHPGPRNAVAVKTASGWIVVERDLDLERPTQVFGLALAVGALLVLLAAFWLGRVSTRPLAAARSGMERIAEGDLGHRLEEQGAPELAGMARSFNRMADRIDQLLRGEKALLAGVSHELRTPLSRLRLELELLRDQGAPAGRLDAMERDLAELDDLIAQLLAISRMQLGETPVQRESVDLRVLAEEASLLAKVEDVRIEGEAWVEADRALVLRALVNLLANAARYGAPPVEVALSEGGFEVRDHGAGVDPADLPHLFDPFFRGEGSRARSTGGLGLGLMLVAQVADLHGGSVSAENRPSGGLVVRVRLMGMAPSPE
ncbi:MAG: HAMP domain-containing protein [Deltaproteobacteria bacterium]|nr:MAG: HAMP domain-containing protein [Deltaproteobacteria bacterium]